MTDNNITPTMRSVRFETHGEPADVLHLQTVAIPEPSPDRVRVSVHATGIAPADWALCRGLFAGDLPRGIGTEVAGTVDAIGDNVTDVRVGDRVVGTCDWRTEPTAGASDFAIMDRWTPVPDSLDLDKAVALVMAVDTAYGHLNLLGFERGKTILINGAGTTIGFAAVQIALVRGMRVIATAGETYAPQLRAVGAQVTAYGKGMPKRVADLAGGPIDLVLNTAPVGGALPDLVAIAGGDPKRVMTISDFPAAQELGVRNTFQEDWTERVDALPEFVQLAAQGKFSIPIAGIFRLEDWRKLLEISLSGHARGKLLLTTGR